MLGRFN